MSKLESSTETPGDTARQEVPSSEELGKSPRIGKSPQITYGGSETSAEETVERRGPEELGGEIFALNGGNADDTRSKTTRASDMTRDELKAHLEANEARVEQLTDRVEGRLDSISEKLDARLDQIQQIDEKMQEREEKLFERVESTLSSYRADRKEEYGELKEKMGSLSGQLEGTKESNRANFRNNRILVGVAGVVLVIVQIIVTLLIT